MRPIKNKPKKKLKKCKICTMLLESNYHKKYGCK